MDQALTGMLLSGAMGDFAGAWRGRGGARACMMECEREESALAPVLPVLRAALEWSTSCWMVATRDTSTCAHRNLVVVELPVCF